MPAVHDSFRLDFKVEILNADEETGIISWAMVPDPERYECIDLDGEPAYRDRFEGFIIPQRVIAEAAPTLTGLPLTAAPPLIKDALAYIDSRGEPIGRRLRGEVHPAPIADPSADLLTEMAGYEQDFAIISVDLVRSTSLAGDLSSSDYLTLIDTISAELAEIAPLFHGHVLKFTGDGGLFFIPGPTRNQQNDLAIDCALTMRGLIYRALNQQLAEAGRPKVDVRVGIDAGASSVRVLGSPISKRGPDIIGEVVNLACKIEGAGEPGDICVGGVAAHSMHRQWRELLEPVVPPTGWPYTDEYGEAYPLYRVKRNMQ
jgi:class 3 adenylate cyclase